MHRLTRRQIFIGGLAVMALAWIGAIVVLISSSSGEPSVPVRDLALQPSDLPPEFALAQEQTFSPQELMPRLPATSQVAEQGLNQAVHLTYRSQDQIPLVDVFVYAYDDAPAAAAAHAFARQSDPDVLRPLDLGNGMTGYAFLDSLVIDGIGDDGFLMTGYVDYDDGDDVSVGDSLQVQIFFMRSGAARAEVLVAGQGIFLDPEAVARDQYVRLRTPVAPAEPQ
jgi:hypothetical protein